MDNTEYAYAVRYSATDFYTREGRPLTMPAASRFSQAHLFSLKDISLGNHIEAMKKHDGAELVLVKVTKEIVK